MAAVLPESEPDLEPNLKPRTREPRPIRADWWSKTLAAVLLGPVIALACSALFVELAAGMALGARAQLAMWLVAPIWMGVLGGVYFFANGRRAWVGLAGASLLLVGLVALLRQF